MQVLIIICLIFCVIGLIRSINRAFKEHQHNKEQKVKLKRFKYPSEKDDDNT